MKWIPVTERLPTEERYYHTKGSHICCYWHDDSKMFDLKGVTHWLDESASLPSSSVTGEEDKEDFALLEEYDLKEKAAKIVNHVFDKVPEDNKRQFLINFIDGLVGSAILHHNNRYVKKINVPDFKTTFK